MNGEHPLPSTKERDIFLGALDQLSPQDCAAYLERACGDDHALRASVEALIKNYKDDDFLEMIALAARPSDLTAEKLGETIGPYKLLEQIGEGGCGVVYLAEQKIPIHRQVALKVIKLGMDTKEVIARFEAERQVLAMMDHSNIAKVFDAGATKTGRPYFVMELVRGKKITDYCDGYKLTLLQRLDLFVKICHAVQHAHQNNIIHRDIKPSNILVTEQDGTPMPKVIDFGIAKATTDQQLTDKTLFTAREQFIGTPAYMSPEQAGSGGPEIDKRTDIYSLGVLLYELLVGCLPFALDEFQQNITDDILHTIREKEPLCPSARLKKLGEKELTKIAQCRQTEPPRLLHSLRGDLDCIVMKCLEKDRTRRYQTANDLAVEIQHYLKGEPITTRPPSRLYRFQKIAQRNKLIFSVASGVVITLILSALYGTLSSSPLEKGLIAYYPFNGNANDASGNGRNGKLWNSPTFVAGPLPGSQAIHLVGQGQYGTSGQYVTIPSIDFSGMGAFTISLWADVQGDISEAECLICFGQEPPDGGPALQINYYSQGNSLSFGAGNVGVSSTTTSYLNQWHRYSMVYANGVLTAYFDGQVLGTASGSIPSTAGNSGMGIHWWGVAPGVSTRFIGSLADVRIYNRALSTSEITQLVRHNLTASNTTNVTPASPQSNSTPMIEGKPQINSLKYGGNADLRSGLNRGLVAYYPLNGNANDVSGNQHNGTIHGGLTFVPSISGQAAHFDGSTAYISVPDQPALRLQSPFSLSAWVKFEGTGRVLHKQGYELEAAESGTGCVLRFNVWFRPHVMDVVDSPRLAKDAWHHVIVTHDGSRLTLYINGVLMAQTAATGFVPQSTSDLNIGRNGYTGLDRFKGCIEEVRIYNRVLSPNEIAQLDQPAHPSAK